jgi:hypothetical protein
MAMRQDLKQEIERTATQRKFFLWAIEEIFNINLPD